MKEHKTINQRAKEANIAGLIAAILGIAIAWAIAWTIRPSLNVWDSVRHGLAHHLIAASIPVIGIKFRCNDHWELYNYLRVSSSILCLRAALDIAIIYCTHGSTTTIIAAIFVWVIFAFCAFVLNSKRVAQEAKQEAQIAETLYK